jgi:hypothetical protein
MTLLAPPSRSANRQARGREKRNITLNTKLTESEFQEVERFCASRSVVHFGEWVRELVMREVRSEDRNFDLTCEVVGLQLLVMNVLAPLARGERISVEQFQGIVKSVQSTKIKAAEEMLSRRQQGKEV